MTPPPVSIPAWDDAWSVGVPALDEQHRGLFRLLAALADALAQGPGRVPAALAELSADCAVHFADEEVYLEGEEYPELVRQQVQHRLFLRRLAALLDRLRAGEAAFDEATLDGLTSWLKGHILGLDQEYAAYVRSRGG